jgi:hypothetical protein
MRALQYSSFQILAQGTEQSNYERDVRLLFPSCEQPQIGLRQGFLGTISGYNIRLRFGAKQYSSQESDNSSPLSI